MGCAGYKSHPSVRVGKYSLIQVSRPRCITLHVPVLGLGKSTACRIWNIMKIGVLVSVVPVVLLPRNSQAPSVVYGVTVELLL